MNSTVTLTNNAIALTLLCIFCLCFEFYSITGVQEALLQEVEVSWTKSRDFNVNEIALGRLIS
jgi:hypothetical protein